MTATGMTEAKVFRDYSRAELDRQYNNRAAVPESPELYAAWRELGAALLDAHAHRLDVPYGPGVRQKLDIILPDPTLSGPGPYPVNVFFHGGYWSSRSKSDLTFTAKPFVEAGAVAVIAGYPLMPDVDLNELIRQCRTAVAWVDANAADINVDPGRLFVSGNSAGGHITAMLMATDWPTFADAPANLIKGGCALSGVFDLEPLRHCYMRDDLKLSADDVARNSPVAFESAPSAPFIVAVGGDESDEFKRQSAELAEAWNGRGGACTPITVPGCNHFTIVAEFADPKTELAFATVRQMGI